MAKQMKLGYWDIRGFAEPIRMLLKHLSIPFEDHRYGFGPEAAEDFPSRDEWLSEKFTLGLDFPNLPYLIDGDVRLTQSVAILKYIARKHGLVASTEPAQVHQEMLEAQIKDVRDRLVRSIYYVGKTATESEFEAELTQLREEMRTGAFKLFEQWLAADETRTFFTGSQISYVDFMLYEYLDWFRVFVQADAFADFPKLTAFFARFEALDNLRDYLRSPEHRYEDCVSPFARIGHRFAKK